MAPPRTRQATKNVPVGNLLGEGGRILLSRGLCLIKTQMKSSLPQKPTHPTNPAQPYIPYTHRRLPAQQTTKKSPPEAPCLWGAFFISPPRTKTVSPSPPQDQNSQNTHTPIPSPFLPQCYINSATPHPQRNSTAFSLTATNPYSIIAISTARQRHAQPISQATRVSQRFVYNPLPRFLYREKKEWAPRFLAFAATTVPFRTKNCDALLTDCHSSRTAKKGNGRLVF